MPSLRKPSLGFAAVAAALLVSAATAGGERFFQAYGDRPGEVLDRSAWEAETPFLRAGAIPFVLPASLQPPAEPGLTATFPFALDPALSAAEQQTLRQVAEGLRLSATGKRLYAYVQRQFADRHVAGRQVQLQLAPLGDTGNRAMTTGTPPDYRVTLNRQLLDAFGWQALVPKLAHELVHIRDYERAVLRSVAIEVSGHAADAAVAYEANMASTGRPFGPFDKLTSLRPIYERQYVPFRKRPTAVAYQRYWRDLMNLVTFERAYRQVYVDDNQETIWNSPPGPPTAGTYVPYDPAYAPLD
jgi:hypothetical protein